VVEILVPKKSFTVYFFNLKEGVGDPLSPPEGEAAQGAYPLDPFSSPSFYLLPFLENPVTFIVIIIAKLMLRRIRTTELSEDLYAPPCLGEALRRGTLVIIQIFVIGM